MEENIQQQQYNNDSAGDAIAIVKSLWAGRKLIIICTAVFIVLGLVAALTMVRTYTVSTTMVPQVSSSRSSSLSSLASLAGFDISSATSGADLSPIIYPQIVSSTPFRRALIYTPLHYEKADTAVCMYTYAMEYSKPTVFGTIKKYTVGLPGTIMGALRGTKEDLVLPEDGAASDEPQPVLVSKDEEKVMEIVAKNVVLTADKKEGYLTLTVVGAEPLQTAELAMKAQQLLQEEITRFRTEKAQSQLDYIQARYNEVKAEAESYQAALAAVTDRSQSMTTTRAKIERDRLQSKYSVANSIYLEMAKQLEQAKMQVKQDTPVFTVVQPVTVPSKPSNSRAKTLVIWTFFGFILGCGIVFLKGYWPKLKEMFAADEQKPADEQPKQ